MYASVMFSKVMEAISPKVIMKLQHPNKKHYVIVFFSSEDVC